VNSQNQTLIQNALKEHCQTFVFSGYQLVAESPKGPETWVGGTTSYWPDGLPVTGETLFDLGSLTKVILTTSVMARLVDQGKLEFDSSLVKLIPSFRGTRYESLTLKQLITHSSGLIAWYPFYQEKISDLVACFIQKQDRFFQSVSECQTVYSDLGFLLLGEVLKRNFGNLPTLFEQEVLLPLQLKGISFGPLPPFLCAATEYCLERKKLVQGEVFDLNTASLGHVASHAGLFSSAENLLPWAREWLKAVQGKSNWLSQNVALAFTRVGQGNPPSTWGMGWDTKSKAFSSAGDLFSKSSFGHLGFPGTSVWIDPEKSGVAILLTNRVHPSRLDERIKRFRPMIHNCIARLWESYGS
jgi:serine-type D-Ala-D-Ala carboxypeptidase